MAANPYQHTDLFTSLLIDGYGWTPGTVTITGGDRKRSWETQRPKGTSGEVTIDHGPKNSEFTATFFFATFEELDRWEELHRFLHSTVSGTKPKTFMIGHPDLTRNHILDVVVESIGKLTHDGKGGASVTVKFLEFRPPKRRPAAKPTTASRKLATSPPDPNAAAKAELAALLEQAKAP